MLRRLAGTKTPASATVASPILTLPSSGRSAPAASWMAVDLPAPFGPTRATTSPARTRKPIRTSRAAT